MPIALQDGQQDAAYDGVDREARDRVVEDRVRIGLVEAVEGSGQPLGMVAPLPRPARSRARRRYRETVSRAASAAETPESISAFIALTRSWSLVP